MSFRITGLPVRRLPYLFRQFIAEPAALGAVREIADAGTTTIPAASA